MSAPGRVVEKSFVETLGIFDRAMYCCDRSVLPFLFPYPCRFPYPYRCRSQFLCLYPYLFPFPCLCLFRFPCRYSRYSRTAPDCAG